MSCAPPVFSPLYSASPPCVRGVCCNRPPRRSKLGSPPSFSRCSLSRRVLPLLRPIYWEPPLFGRVMIGPPSCSLGIRTPFLGRLSPCCTQKGGFVAPKWRGIFPPGKKTLGRSTQRRKVPNFENTGKVFLFRRRGPIFSPKKKEGVPEY